MFVLFVNRKTALQTAITHAHAVVLNMVNFDLQTAKIQPEFRSTSRAAIILCTGQCNAFIRRDAMLSAVIRVSVTRLPCIKMAEHIIEILSLSDRPIIIVFRHRGLLRKSDGFTRASNTRV